MQANQVQYLHLKPTVLLVDDNIEILSFLEDDLSDLYIIHQATDGRQALDILKTQPVQLIVSDIMMPGMDGYELVDQIKSSFEYSHIPIILLTAKTTLNSKIKGLEIGADAYIDKPFSPEYLKAQINSLLSNRDKLKKFFASSPLASIKTIAYSKAEEHFLEKLNSVIYENLTNTNLGVELLADRLNVSRPTLYRKIKAISDLTPNELINIARLKKAAELLLDGSHKIYEISDMVGYSSQTHFGRNFSKQFGMSPSEYIAKAKKESR